MSLKKIAEMTGLSPSTVSRILNNKSFNCASEETKQRVWKAAKELNYTPNLSARNLKKGITTNTIRPLQIMIVLGRFGKLEDDPFFRELFRYIEEELFHENCKITRILNTHELTTSPIEHCDGILLLGRCSEDNLLKLKRYTTNIVGIGRNPTNYKIDEIICDGSQAASLAVEYLIENHYQKIGYVGDCSYESRYVGYCETLLKYHYPLNTGIIYDTDQTAQTGYELFMGLEDPFAFDSLVCANDATTIGILRALTLKAPKLIGQFPIVSIDNTRELENSFPNISAVHIPTEDMGRISVQILLSRIRHRHREYMRVEFPCHLVRRSCDF